MEIFIGLLLLTIPELILIAICFHFFKKVNETSTKKTRQRDKYIDYVAHTTNTQSYDAIRKRQKGE